MISRRTIPNMLTLLRLVLLLPFCWLGVTQFPAPSAWLLGIFILAAITDWLDGYLARTWQVGSELGKMLDPIADKALVLCAGMVLIAQDTLVGVHIIALVLIVCRELIVSGLRDFLGAKVKIAVTFIAKCKTTAQLLALTTLIAAPLAGAWMGEVYIIGLAALWLSALLSWLSAADYIRTAWPYLK